MKRIFTIGVYLLIIGVLGSGWMLMSGVSLNVSGKLIQMNQIIDASEVDDIQVTSDNATIEIHSSVNHEVQAKLTGSVGEYQIEEFSMNLSNRTLQIIEKDAEKPRTLINRFTFPKPLKLKIYLPQKKFQQLTFHTANGDMLLQRFQGDQIKSTSENGNIKLTNFEGIFSLRTKEGSIIVESYTPFQGKNRVETDHGDIDVMTLFDPLTLNIDLQSRSGSVKSDFQMNDPSDQEKIIDGTDQRIKGLIGSVISNPPTLLARSESGDVWLGK